MLDAYINTAGHSLIHFEKGRVRRAMRLAGREVQKEARRLVSRRAISLAGEMPGRDTGALMRSIKYRVSRPGFLVKVMPDQTAEMGDAYYPAMLWYGVTGQRRRRDHKAQVKDGRWRVAPRGNYMTQALDNRRAAVQAILAAAMDGALQPA